MKKLGFILAVLVAMASYVYAHEGHEEMDKGKTVTVQGTLVDSNCYLKYGHEGDKHDDMKTCGRECLEDGVPAGLLVDGKLYVLIFPPKVFSGYVGKMVEVTGNVVNENLLLPKKAAVVEKDAKKNIKLSGKVMM